MNSYSIVEEVRDLPNSGNYLSGCTPFMTLRSTADLFTYFY